MKYAASLARQGELIDAATADYTTFARELLTCPNCGSSVFLVKNYERRAVTRQMKSGREVSIDPCQIPAFFSHHHHDENIECEAYNRTIDSVAAARSAAIARNQRADLFRSRFLAILVQSRIFSVFKDVPIAEIQRLLKAVHKQGVFCPQIPATLFTPKTPVRFETKPLKPVIDNCVKFSYQMSGRRILTKIILPGLICGDISILDSDDNDVGTIDVSDLNLQHTIEALDFLYAPAQRQLRTDVFWLIVFEMADYICTGAGFEIMSSAEIGMSSDRVGRMTRLPKFLQEQLATDLDQTMHCSPDLLESLLKPAERFDLSSPPAPKKAVDTGVRRPIALLTAALLTIDWQQIYSQIGKT